MVMIFCPAKPSAGGRQERMALGVSLLLLWSSTVQAPQAPSPQPYLVPVRPSRFLRTESSVSPGAASTLCSLPLMFRTMAGMVVRRDYRNAGSMDGARGLQSRARGCDGQGSTHRFRHGTCALYRKLLSSGCPLFLQFRLSPFSPFFSSDVKQTLVKP